MLKTRLFIVLLLLYTLVSAKDTLVFAPLPMENTKTVFTQFSPMIQYLEKQLNKNIVIDYNTNYADILKKIKQEKIDLAYLGPLPYVELKDSYPDALPLVHFKNIENEIFYTCSIITFATNNTKLENIIHKKIALTQPLSTCGYLSVDGILKKSNSSLKKNYYNYLERHDSVALSVVKGDFEFGGVKTSIAKKYSNLGIKELAKTSLLPGFALVGNQKTLSEDTLKKIQDSMINAKKEDYNFWGKNINHGSKKAKDSNYNNLRNLKSNIKIPAKGNYK